MTNNSAASGSSGRSYSSAGSGNTENTHPGGVTTTPGRSYSSGSNTGFNPPTGSRPTQTGAVAGGSTKSSTQPKGGDSFDSLAARDRRMAASREMYQKGQAPRTDYVDHSGQTRSIDAADSRVGQLRRELDHERWVNRDLRQSQVFGPYYSNYSVLRPSVYVYHDSFSDYFWLWLLAQNLDTRANWAYNHYDAMDQARYREMLAKDANLEARIRQLEDEKKQRDPTYVPSGIDADLMYDDDFVTAAYNPAPRTTTASTPSTSIPSSSPISPTSASRPATVNVPHVPSPPSAPNSPYTPAGPYAHRANNSGTVWETLLTLVIFVAVLWAFVWLVFFKRWGGNHQLGRW